MTPNQAGTVARRARKLLRRGLLTHHAYAVLDCILWACRTPGSDRTSVSYSRLQQLVHVARGTACGAITQLTELRLVLRLKRRVRVTWGGGVASRQATNIYVIVAPPDTEFTTQAVLRGQARKKGSERVEMALNRLQNALVGGLQTV